MKKEKDSLYFYEREGRDLMPKVALPVTCTAWKLDRFCSVCGENTVQQFVELKGKKSPLMFWHCTSCSLTARTRSRP